MDISIQKIQKTLKEQKNDLIDKLKEYRRVLKITDKPDRDEFEMSAKVTGIGILIIGIIGFLFYLATNLLKTYLTTGGA